MARNDCTCGLCAPQPGHRYDPEWGYDLDKVPSALCGVCHEPIGFGPYVLDCSVARFGSMGVWHPQCEPRNKDGSRTRVGKRHPQDRPGVGEVARAAA